MKFFIDTANIDEIREAYALGILAGVTTNPSLVAKEKGVSFHDRLKEITDLFLDLLVQKLLHLIMKA